MNETVEMIDRQVALKKLCAACYNTGSFACISCVIPEIIKGIPAIEAEPVLRWIPCCMGMPLPLQNVIVCTVINTVTVAWINGDHWEFADTGNGRIEKWSFEDVKYWMHMPEPLK